MSQELRMPGSHVDVNMHPTKKEVGFLHQEDVVDSLRAAIEHQLLASNNEYASPSPSPTPSFPKQGCAFDMKLPLQVTRYSMNACQSSLGTSCPNPSSVRFCSTLTRDLVIL